MSSLGKCLFRSSAFFFFLDWVVFLILSYMSCLYILDINSLLLIEFVNVLSHSIGFLSFLSIVSLAMQKLLCLIRFLFFFF